MKATFFTLAALSACAYAVPMQGHQHLHEKRQHNHARAPLVTQTNVVYATAAQVLVYVDSNGNPLSTSTVGQVVTAETVAPAPEPKLTFTPKVKAAAPAPAADGSKKTSDGGLDNGYGIVYSPYTNSGSCKSQGQVNQDFNTISGYNTVRIYGVDCDQANTVIKAASAKGMTVFAGIYNIDQVSTEVQTLIDAAKGKWDVIKTVSVGNEGVNNGQYTVSAVASAVSTARSLLRAAGYTGPVVTVDTFVAIIANPEMCDISDYVAANCHAFFDGGVTAQEAGAFVLSQAQRVSSVCGGKHTVITESGWPSAGSSNGKAVPSRQNQKDAVASIKSKFSNNVILFTAFNDRWKANNAGTFGAEQSYGIYGDSSA